jgi:hypothetical protein
MSKELELMVSSYAKIPRDKASKHSTSPKRSTLSKNESLTLMLVADDFIKKCEYVLSLISPELEDSQKKEEGEDVYDQLEVPKPNLLNFYKLWITNNPILGQEINLLLEKAVKYMDALLGIKINDNTSFEVKIYLKKQQKETDIIIDGFRDLRKVVKFANSINDNSHMVMNILKIDYKYGIKAKMQAVENAKTHRPTSNI